MHLVRPTTWGLILYRIVLNRLPGFYFVQEGFEPGVNATPAFNRDRRLIETALNEENLLRGANHNISRVMSMAGEQTYFSKESVVRGHYVYKHIYTPGIGEELSVEKEPGNLRDNFTVSVVKNDYMVGHLRHLSLLHS